MATLDRTALCRRALLALPTGLAAQVAVGQGAIGQSAAGQSAAGQAAAAAGRARLLAPGPEAGPLAHWAGRLCAGLSRGGAWLEPEVLGGPDGVTAANRFVVSAAPDGRTLLLLPGLAAQARLVGDPRAHFDPAGWLPVCAMVVPSLLAARRPMPMGAGAAPVRLALPAPDHPAAAALLALDLLGVAAVPVPGIAPAQAEAALAQGRVDAAVLSGPGLPARLATLGARPWFTLGGAHGEAGVPGLADTVAPTAPRALLAAMQAAGVAAHLVAALVLPTLTPADVVARWRGLAGRWAEDPDRLPAPRTLPVPDAATQLATLAAPAEAIRAYRDWLEQRLHWRAA